MKTILFFFIALLVASSLQAQDVDLKVKVVTIVESIVPGGVGRSRMIETITEASNGDHSKQDIGKRRALKENDFTETKLLNFYSLLGINFQNIASNDAVIAAKIAELARTGWKLSFVSTGVESKSGMQDGEGIFITRLIFYN